MSDWHDEFTEPMHDTPADKDPLIAAMEAAGYTYTRTADHGNCCRTLYLLLPGLEPFSDSRRTCISGIGRLHCDASLSACLDLCGASIWICRFGFPGNHVC